MVTIEAHVHRRPGGAVAVQECRCPDPRAWPIPSDDVSEDVAVLARPAPTPPPPPPGVRPSRAEGDMPSARLVRRAAQWVKRSALDAVARSLRLLSSGRRTVRSVVSMLMAVAWAVTKGAGTVAVAVIGRLGGAAQVGGVGVGTWAAWEIEPIAGKVVLAVGLLFLGGALARVVREVRNGSTR